MARHYRGYNFMKIFTFFLACAYGASVQEIPLVTPFDGPVSLFSSYAKVTQDFVKMNSDLIENPFSFLQHSSDEEVTFFSKKLWALENKRKQLFYQVLLCDEVSVESIKRAEINLSSVRTIVSHILAEDGEQDTPETDDDFSIEGQGFFSTQNYNDVKKDVKNILNESIVALATAKNLFVNHVKLELENKINDAFEIAKTEMQGYRDVNGLKILKIYPVIPQVQSLVDMLSHNIQSFSLQCSITLMNAKSLEEELISDRLSEIMADLDRKIHDLKYFIFNTFAYVSLEVSKIQVKLQRLHHLQQILAQTGNKIMNDIYSVNTAISTGKNPTGIFLYSSNMDLSIDCVNEYVNLLRDLREIARFNKISVSHQELTECLLSINSLTPDFLHIFKNILPDSILHEHVYQLSVSLQEELLFLDLERMTTPVDMIAEVEPNENYSIKQNISAKIESLNTFALNSVYRPFFHRLAQHLNEFVNTHLLNYRNAVTSFGEDRKDPLIEQSVATTQRIVWDLSSRVECLCNLMPFEGSLSHQLRRHILSLQEKPSENRLDL